MILVGCPSDRCHYVIIGKQKGQQRADGSASTGTEMGVGQQGALGCWQLLEEA